MATQGLALRFVALTLTLLPCESELLGASVVPHGDFAIAPFLLQEGTRNRTLAERLHKAALEVTKVVQEERPDTILLIAPHAIALSNDFAVYTSSNGSGTAMIGGDLHDPSTPLLPFSVSVAGDASLANSLVDSLRAQRGNVSALLAWADSEPAPLRWSEVVPLWFLAALTKYSAPAPRPGVVVWSQPLRRLPCSSCMASELLELGSKLYRILAALPTKVWVVISADLAHVHSAGVNPYPPNNTAADLFDKAVGEWAATLDETALLQDATEVVDNALSCGYTGLVLLHGILRSAPEGLPAWRPTLHEGPSHPTYYGMMVSSMQRQRQTGRETHSAQSDLFIDL